MISTVAVESWPTFTDHNIVISHTAFDLSYEPVKEEVHLLNCGKRLKQLNFNKAQWLEVQAELSEVDWSDLEQAASSSPTKALNIFLEELLPIVERHVPAKQRIRKKSENSNGQEEKTAVEKTPQSQK